MSDPNSILNETEEDNSVAESNELLKSSSDDFSLITRSEMYFENPCVYMQTATWCRDSHDLFDYESRNLHKQSFFIRRSACILRSKFDVQVVPEGRSYGTRFADLLLSVQSNANKGCFSMLPADKNFSVGSALRPKKVWLIVKNMRMKQYHLQEGDIIKLGRYKLLIKQLIKHGSSPEVDILLDDPENIPRINVDPRGLASTQCRICLLDTSTALDPLVCPCKCKGSIKYVHLECLRYWVDNRLSLLQNNQDKASFFYKNIQCELCKNVIPAAIRINDNKKVSIVNIPTIEAPLIILETMTGERGIHVISMKSKETLKLGRGHDADVRVPDVSISRHHSSIRFSKEKFFLEDNNSKFGTLVLLKDKQLIKPTNLLSVQVGRTILNLSIRNSPYFFEDMLVVKDISEEKKKNNSDTLEENSVINPKENNEITRCDLYLQDSDSQLRSDANVLRRSFEMSPLLNYFGSQTITITPATRTEEETLLINQNDWCASSSENLDAQHPISNLQRLEEDYNAATTPSATNLSRQPLYLNPQTHAQAAASEGMTYLTILPRETLEDNTGSTIVSEADVVVTSQQPLQSSQATPCHVAAEDTQETTFDSLPTRTGREGDDSQLHENEQRERRFMSLRYYHPSLQHLNRRPDISLTNSR